MTIKINELKRWLDTLDDRDRVYVDEGGLILVSVLDLDAYMEVGGVALQEEDDRDAVYGDDK